jgi:hypothetical protein
MPAQKPTKSRRVMPRAASSRRKMVLRLMCREQASVVPRFAQRERPFRAGLADAEDVSCSDCAFSSTG